jgi:PAS domain S-box-containing protein
MPQRFTRRIVLFLSLLVLVAAAWLAWFFFGPARVDHSKVYRIGYGNDVPLHFEGPDGKPTGLAVELVRESARRQGIQLEWVQQQLPDRAPLDLRVLETIRTGREGTTHYTEPYLVAKSGYLVLADSPIRNIGDLRTARISHINYRAHRDALGEQFPDARLVPAVSSDEALNLLRAGQADAAFVDQYAVLTALLRGGQEKTLRMLPVQSTPRPMGLACRPDRAAVADEIRQGMRALIADGFVQPLLDRWAFFPNVTTDIIVELDDRQRQVRWLAAGMGILGILLALAAWFALLARRQAAQLRRAESLLRNVADRVPGVVYQFRLRPDGTSSFPYASEAIRQIYRVSPDEVRSDARKVLAALHPDDQARLSETIKQSAAELSTWSCEYRVRFADGTVRWLLGNAQPQRDADGSTLWHGFITDITERKTAETALHTFERKIQETQKLESLGVLAGGIAHDFNNILTGILGNATLAGLDIPVGSPSQSYLESIRKCSLRAADLCKQMLAYSGKGRFVITHLSLNTLVEETTQLLQLSISKQTVLRFNLSPNLPVFEADATQIRQVIMNLVINASEAIGAKSGVVCLNTGVTRVDRDYLASTILAPELPPGNYVFLEVSDNGSGMDVEMRSKIFDPFFTTKFTGRGLGLAAVLGIVRGHKGAIKVYSEVGRGTTFKLLFPCATGAAERTTPPSLATPAWRGAGRVLVVDDEETVRSTAALMLKRLGFDAALAADGREAVEIFRQNPGGFVLVLMDLTMPRMDGRQAFEELRRIRAEVRVVLMSGFNEQEAISQFSGKGLAGFLPKPFQMDTLGEALRRALALEEK